MNTAQWKTASPIGDLFLIASERGLQGVHWKRQEIPMAPSLEGDKAVLRLLTQAAEELERYFRGSLKSFAVPLDVQGTAFQKRVWGELVKIPYGATVSYRDIARRLNNEGSVRAVGAANGKNPVSIIVPCHRVIASNGTLCGYAGGLPIKAALLEFERTGRRELWAM